MTTAIIEGIRTLYPRGDWGLYTEVRSATGVTDALRSADAVAVNLLPSGRGKVVGFEVKERRPDFLVELHQPTKWQAVGMFCTAWYLAVPAPFKKILLSLSELPQGWGLIEVGTGKPSVIVEAVERDAEPISPAFMLSLLRSADNASQAETFSSTTSAPMQVITQPHYSRHEVMLACGHFAPKPLTKKMPREVPCFTCAESNGSDKAAAWIAEASPADLRAMMAQIDARLKGAA